MPAEDGRWQVAGCKALPVSEDGWAIAVSEQVRAGGVWWAFREPRTGFDTRPSSGGDGRTQPAARLYASNCLARRFENATIVRIGGRPGVVGNMLASLTYRPLISVSWCSSTTRPIAAVPQG